MGLVRIPRIEELPARVRPTSDFDGPSVGTEMRPVTAAGPIPSRKRSSVTLVELLTMENNGRLKGVPAFLHYRQTIKHRVFGGDARRIGLLPAHFLVSRCWRPNQGNRASAVGLIIALVSKKERSSCEAWLCLSC